jgi:hypothetical protein
MLRRRKGSGIAISAAAPSSLRAPRAAGIARTSIALQPWRTSLRCDDGTRIGWVEVMHVTGGFLKELGEGVWMKNKEDGGEFGEVEGKVMKVTLTSHSLKSNLTYLAYPTIFSSHSCLTS